MSTGHIVYWPATHADMNASAMVTLANGDTIDVDQTRESCGHVTMIDVAEALARMCGADVTMPRRRLPLIEKKLLLLLLEQSGERLLCLDRVEHGNEPTTSYLVQRVVQHSEQSPSVHRCDAGVDDVLAIVKGAFIESLQTLDNTPDGECIHTLMATYRILRVMEELTAATKASGAQAVYTLCRDSLATHGKFPRTCLDPSKDPRGRYMVSLRDADEPLNLSYAEAALLARHAQLDPPLPEPRASVFHLKVDGVLRTIELPP